MQNPLAETLFLFFILLTLGSALVVVFSNHIVRSAFSLLLTFFGVAGIYVFLHADFLAATQLLVYVGGILVLILFAVMLTHKIKTIRLSNESRRTPGAAVLSIAVFFLLALTALTSPWPRKALPDAPTAAPLGELFLSEYLVPFEAVSVLLLVVMIGAAILARRHDGETGR